MTRQDDTGPDQAGPDHTGQTDPDLLAIRSLLQDRPDASRASEAAPAGTPVPERRRNPVPVPDARVPAEPEEDLRAQIRAAQEQAALIEAGSIEADGAEPPRAGRLAGATTPVLARLRGYRPTRRHIVVAIVVLLALWRPWLLVAMVVVPMLIVAGTFAAIGQDRFWSGVLRGYRRMQSRNPVRAERLRARADRFALRWDAFLDRFPEGSVDALYLPDLNSLQEAQAQHAEALDRRFERLQQEARTQ